MRYLGGKHRIRNRLLPTLQDAVTEASAYVEPFIGGGSVMAVVEHPRRIGADANEALITMWRALQRGWEPPREVTEDDYRRIAAARDPHDPLTAFIGFGCSWAGKWFGGYARDNRGRNYAKDAANSLASKLETLRDVCFLATGYRDLSIPAGAVLYCDPPYAGTTAYGAVEPFDHDAFWAWARQQHRDGNVVFVSEYAAPADFVAVLEIETKTEVRTRANGREPRVEKLFMFDG